MIKFLKKLFRCKSNPKPIIVTPKPIILRYSFQRTKTPHQSQIDPKDIHIALENIKSQIEQNQLYRIEIEPSTQSSKTEKVIVKILLQSWDPTKTENIRV